jgi:DNA-binding NarL/FixJ family response regulator
MTLEAAAGANCDIDPSAPTTSAFPQTVKPNVLRVPARRPPRRRTLGPYDLTLLQLASEGLVDKGIALRVGLRPNQVHERWRRIREAFGAKDRSNAVAIALALGLISPPSQALRLVAENSLAVRACQTWGLKP